MPTVPASYQALIDGPRVSARTRAALAARALPDDPAYRPRCLSPDLLAVLRAALDRVLPQPPDAAIDLAARIDTMLDAGKGDGWRFEALPPDPEAYRAGLRTLEAQAMAQAGDGFAALPASAQDALLRLAAAGEPEGPPTHSGLTGAQMRLWFEDLRADAARAYVAHPATLARMGYGGVAYGGDGEPKPGFVRVGIGETEDWEPRAAP
jgi:hypothetical protein